VTQPVIAIVGAGFSGTATAVQLLRHATLPLEVLLIERAPRQFARGVAYSSFDPRHVLNVPAERMGATPAAPRAFADWLEQRGLAPASGATGWYAPRQLFGQYLEHELAAAELAARPGVRLTRVIDEAVDLTVEGSGATLELRRGPSRADAVVLALGNFPPPHPRVEDPVGYDSPRYFNRAWEPGAVDGIHSDDAVLLIGTGLSSIDLLVSLRRDGHRGPITALSRRGRWPVPHQADAPWRDWLAGQQPASVRALIHLAHVELAAAREQGVHWAAVINAMRPHLQRVWQGLPVIERQRFLRHGRALWEVARHRMPQASATLIADLTAAGQLETLRGRLQAVRDLGDALEVRVRQPGGALRGLRVARVINCTGAESNYKKLQDPFVRNLMKHGLVRADALHLGLDATPEGALLDSHGVAHAALHTLGPVMKGTLWETTAVGEIRAQAAALAQRLLREKGSN
jgi:uncharacterized NAD(P)/FAD-binding protein YdhS